MPDGEQVPYWQRPALTEWLRQQYGRALGIPPADQKAFDAYQKAGGMMNIRAWQTSGRPKADQALTPRARRLLAERGYPGITAPVTPIGREEFMRTAQLAQQAAEEGKPPKLPQPVDPTEALSRELLKYQQYQQVTPPPPGATPEEQIAWMPPRGEPSIIDLIRKAGLTPEFAGGQWSAAGQPLQAPLPQPYGQPPETLAWNVARGGWETVRFIWNPYTKTFEPPAGYITAEARTGMSLAEKESAMGERKQTFTEEEARRARQAQAEETRLAAELAWRQEGLERNRAAEGQRPIVATQGLQAQRTQADLAAQQQLASQQRPPQSEDEIARLALAQREAESLRNYELQRQAQLASLRAQPASWLEYASLAKQAPAVQPWMLPLAGSWNTGAQAGGSLPNWALEGPLTGLQPLITPSAQYWQQISPQSRQQYQGYEQARTGATPETSQWRIWQMAPPRGR